MAVAPFKEIHLRLTQEQKERLGEAARKRRTPLATTLRDLVDEALTPDAEKAVTAMGEQELVLHVLVAVEQVLLLVESILPEGPGAAEKVVADAAQAAQRRLSDIEVARWWGAAP